MSQFFFACLAPPRCEACETLVPKVPSLCPDCVAGLRPLLGPHCRHCALPFERGSPSGRLCAECLERPPSFQKASSAFEFEGTAVRLCHDFKFGQQLQALQPVLPVALESFTKVLYDFAPQLLAPVPLGWWRRFRRGFNQSYVLAQALQQGLGSELPYLAGLRRRGTPPQARRGRADRHLAMRGVFEVQRPRLARGFRILIVDDIMTTGATVEALSKSLLQAGAEAVQVWTLARRGRKQHRA